MAVRKPKVIVTRKLPDPVETRMRELFDTELNLTDQPMGQDELLDALQRAEVLVPTITDRIDSRLLSRAGPSLKLIANFGAGVDNIDVATANARGIAVTNTPGVLTEDTADMTMALILASARRVVEGAQVVQTGGFQGWSPTWMMGRRIYGKRLGIVGMGRIGQAVAKRARPLVCRSTITIANPSAPASKKSWRPPIGRALTRCWPAWMWCQSTAPTHPQPSTSCRPGA